MPLFPSEHLSVVQCQMCFVDEKVEKLLVGEPQAAAVEPYQERCLRSPWPYAGDVFAGVVLQEAIVAIVAIVAIEAIGAIVAIVAIETIETVGAAGGPLESLLDILEQVVDVLQSHAKAYRSVEDIHFGESLRPEVAEVGGVGVF